MYNVKKIEDEKPPLDRLSLLWDDVIHVWFVGYPDSKYESYYACADSINSPRRARRITYWMPMLEDPEIILKKYPTKKEIEEQKDRASWMGDKSNYVRYHQNWTGLEVGREVESLLEWILNKENGDPPYFTDPSLDY